MIEGIFQLHFHYSSFRSPIHHYREAMPEHVSVHIDTQLHCHAEIPVLWPAFFFVGCWTAWKKPLYCQYMGILVVFFALWLWSVYLFIYFLKHAVSAVLASTLCRYISHTWRRRWTLCYIYLHQYHSGLIIMPPVNTGTCGIVCHSSELLLLNELQIIVLMNLIKEIVLELLAWLALIFQASHVINEVSVTWPLTVEAIGDHREWSCASCTYSGETWHMDNVIHMDWYVRLRLDWHL